MHIPNVALISEAELIMFIEARLKKDYPNLEAEIKKITSIVPINYGEKFGLKVEFENETKADK